MTYYKAMLPDLQESMGLFLESLEDIVAIVNLHTLLFIQQNDSVEPDLSFCILVSQTIDLFS